VGFPCFLVIDRLEISTTQLLKESFLCFIANLAKEENQLLGVIAILSQTLIFTGCLVCFLIDKIIDDERNILACYSDCKSVHVLLIVSYLSWSSQI